MRAIRGKKTISTRIFDEAGHQVPVTLVEIGPNIVTQIKTLEKDGYQAIQVGVGSKKRLNKPISGHLKKLDIKPESFFEIKSDQDFKVGDKITLDDFREKELVNVTAISKGKGFAGTVKRHHFHTGPKTHGSNNYRQPGSIGDTGPQRVVKGRRMSGHLGAKRTTVQNLEIIKLDKVRGLMFIKGGLPGPQKTEILIWSNHDKD